MRFWVALNAYKRKYSFNGRVLAKKSMKFVLHKANSEMTQSFTDWLAFKKEKN